MGKDAKGDEVELSRRLVELKKIWTKLQRNIDPCSSSIALPSQGRMSIKTATSDLNWQVKKERLEKQKQKLEESIEKWKAKAELEENKKLLLNIDYLKSEKQIENPESRATELMSDMISIRLRHDTELNNMKESHDNSMKEIQKENEQLNKELTEKKQEVKNQRRLYGEKMTDVRIRLDEAKAEERIVKAKLYANQITTDELAANLKQKEQENINMKEKMELENKIM